MVWYAFPYLNCVDHTTRQIQVDNIFLSVRSKVIEHQEWRRWLIGLYLPVGFQWIRSFATYFYQKHWKYVCSRFRFWWMYLYKLLWRGFISKSSQGLVEWCVTPQCNHVTKCIRTYFFKDFALFQIIHLHWTSDEHYLNQWRSISLGFRVLRNIRDMCS